MLKDSGLSLLDEAENVLLQRLVDFSRTFVIPQTHGMDGPLGRVHESIIMHIGTITDDDDS